MAKFNPSRRQATRALSQAIFALASCVIRRAEDHAELQPSEEVFISYPKRKFRPMSAGLDRRVKLINAILSAVGHDGRKTLAKQPISTGRYPMEIVYASEEYWSIVFDFPTSAPKELGGNVVRSLVIHGDHRVNTVAFDVSISSQRYDKVIQREGKPEKNLTTEQLSRAYLAYLKLSHWCMHYDISSADVGVASFSLVSVLSALDTSSLIALVEEANQQSSVPPDEHRLGGEWLLDVKEHTVPGRKGYDDATAWDLIHIANNQTVDYLISFDIPMNPSDSWWSQKKTERIHRMGELEELLSRLK